MIKINWSDAPMLAAVQHVLMAQSPSRFFPRAVETEVIESCPEDSGLAANLYLTEGFDLKKGHYTRYQNNRRTDATVIEPIHRMNLNRPIVRILLNSLYYLFSNAQRTRFELVMQERELSTFGFGRRAQEIYDVHPYISRLVIRYPYIVISTSVRTRFVRGDQDDFMRIYWGLPL